MDRTQQGEEMTSKVENFIKSMSKLTDKNKLDLDGKHTDVRANTRAAQTTFLSDSQDLADSVEHSRFDNIHLWLLFWVFTNAAHEVVKQRGSPDHEDTRSGDLLCELQKATTTMEGLAAAQGLAPPFGFAYSRLFGIGKPSAHEDILGADILLLLSGRKLLGRPGIFLFWIQAKTNDNQNKSFTLDVAQANANGLQIDALLKNHEPANGSEALYLLYSKTNPFLTVASADCVKALAEAKALEDPKGQTVDIAEFGFRFQEYISAKIEKAKSHCLMDVDALVKFLDAKSGGAPYWIMSISSGPETAQSLLDKVKEHYTSKFDPQVPEVASKKKKHVPGQNGP